MKTQCDSIDQRNPIAATLLIMATYLVGVVGLIPALLILFMLAAMGGYGTRLVWQLVRLLCS